MSKEEMLFLSTSKYTLHIKHCALYACRIGHGITTGTQLSFSCNNTSQQREKETIEKVIGEERVSGSLCFLGC